MTVRGRIKAGKVVLSRRLNLPDGMEVSVKLVPEPRRNGRRQSSKRPRRSRSSKLSKYAGTFDDLPSDAARRIDDYLYGYTQQR